MTQELNLKKILLILSAAAALHGGAAQAETKATAFLDGNWEGELKGANEPTSMRLHIQGDKAQVFAQGDDNRWREIKAGKFRVLQHNFNALIYAQDSWAGDCWDETWSFAVTQNNANQLVTKFSRVVSNVRCMKPGADSFGSQSSGLLNPQAVEAPAAAH